MHLFDPSRRRVNDTPTFVHSRSVLPRLNLFPANDGTTIVSAMVPAIGEGRFVARQVSRPVADTQLQSILENYRADPESTLETLFSISLAPVAEPSDRDFARDLAEGADEELRAAKKSALPKSLSDRLAAVDF